MLVIHGVTVRTVKKPIRLEVLAPREERLMRYGHTVLEVVPFEGTRADLEGGALAWMDPTHLPYDEHSICRSSGVDRKSTGIRIIESVTGTKEAEILAAGSCHTGIERVRDSGFLVSDVSNTSDFRDLLFGLLGHIKNGPTRNQQHLQADPALHLDACDCFE